MNSNCQSSTFQSRGLKSKSRGLSRPEYALRKFKAPRHVRVQMCGYTFESCSQISLRIWGPMPKSSRRRNGEFGGSTRVYSYSAGLKSPRATGGPRISGAHRCAHRCADVIWVHEVLGPRRHFKHPPSQALKSAQDAEPHSQVKAFAEYVHRTAEAAVHFRSSSLIAPCCHKV